MGRGRREIVASQNIKAGTRSSPLKQSDVDFSASQAKGRLEEMALSLGGQEMLLGDTDFVDGWLLETHTIGCRNAADTAEENWWDEHWQIYEEMRDDPQTVVLGDPADGIFATATLAREE